MKIKRLMSNQIELALTEEYYVDYLKYLFPYEDNVLKLSAKHDIGNLIYANVLHSEYPKKVIKYDYSIIVELPYFTDDKRFYNKFISFDAHALRRINRFIKLIFNLEFENFKLVNFEFYKRDRKECFYTFLEKRNLLNSEGVSIDSLLKKEARSRQNLLFTSA